MQENANKWHFKYTDFNSSTRVIVFGECIYVFLSKSCSPSLYTMLIVDKCCICLLWQISDSTNWSQKKTKKRTV